MTVLINAFGRMKLKKSLHVLMHIRGGRGKGRGSDPCSYFTVFNEPSKTRLMICETRFI